MALKLVLSLTGDRLILELVRPEHAGFGQVLGGLLGRRPTHEASRTPIARVVLVGPMDAGNVVASLGRALADLQALHGKALKGMPMDVQLGLDHARIGLVDLSGVSPAALTAGNCDAYAQAWVAQMLHLDASTPIVRWALHELPQKLLVSCVGRQIVDALANSCAQSGLKFSSCRPAMLSALKRQTRDPRAEPAADLTLVWTEVDAQGGRSGGVQFLRWHNKHLSALWRGWVPRSPSEGGNDLALEEAITRFERANPARSGGSVDRVVWPSPAAAGTLA